MTRHPSRFRRNDGFSLLELLVTLLVMGFVVISFSKFYGSFQKISRMKYHRMQALLLAQDLREEIMSKSFTDPKRPVVFGLEPGSISTDRLDYDDIDDYRNFSEFPPRDVAGNILPGLTGFERIADIHYVNPEKFSRIVQPFTTDYVRITVRVFEQKKQLAELEWIKTRY